MDRRARPYVVVILMFALLLLVAGCGVKSGANTSSRGQLEQGDRGQLGGLTNNQLDNQGVGEGNTDASNGCSQSSGDENGDAPDDTGGGGSVAGGGSKAGGQPVSQNYGSKGTNQQVNSQKRKGVRC